MNIFYVKKGQNFLNQIESRHCVQVLRKKVGDKIITVDGFGNWYECKITTASLKRCEFEISETKTDVQARNYYLHIGIALTKNASRFEWFLEKSTEIGIDEITPILCDHSERKIVNRERLLKILISAMKQTLKATLPRLNNSSHIDSFIKLVEGNNGSKFIGNLAEKNTNLKNACKSKENITIIIGPEGDFSKREFDMAIQSGFQSVSLGKSRLRVETAGVVACAIVNGELG